MKFSQQFQEATAVARQTLIETPAVQLFLGADVPKEAYAMFLRETYHLSKHTSRFICAAASRMTDAQEAIRTRFMHHALEEDGHHKFALKDLKNIGYDSDYALNSRPLPGTEAIISFHYYLAHMGNPISVMGAVMVFEGLAEDFAGQAASALRSKQNMSQSSVTFLHTHAEFDIEHMKEAREVLDTLIKREEDKAATIDVANKMYRFYQMNFEDIGIVIEQVAPTEV